MNMARAITFFSISIVLAVQPAFAEFDQSRTDLYLQQLYTQSNVEKLERLSIQRRVEYFSGLFLGRPYLGGALGEGAQSAFDNDPLYRFDAFDCTTFVETVTALSLSRSDLDFKKNMNAIRYSGGRVSLLSRNHFTSADWNPNVEKIGILKDVTADIGKTEVTSLETLIDKRAWYEKQAASMVLTEGNRDAKIGAILTKTQILVPQLSQLNFLSKEIMTTKPELLKSFPKAGVINIVRKNWKVKDAIGTDLDISHQGVFFERDGEIIFRHASFKKSSQFVVEVPLLEYVKNNFNDQTFAGVNVLSFAEGL
ncbi:N-acetylmuramoyl-L-alanine amidase-like domain-containing protein [Bdellovibrio bacteriovorus]|uniref:N-acetylmuramoyl-L-alanine amidase-like domain-containing protein n=1 Tax=Bdellovibrio bacteriovorus TaxID=959 RepID=UPI0035A6DE33